MNGSPTRATVVHIRCTVCIPGFDVHGFADIEVDIRIGLRRGFLIGPHLSQMPDYDGTAADHGSQNHLRCQTPTQVRRQRPCRATNAQHQQVKGSSEQLGNDDAASR